MSVCTSAMVAANSAVRQPIDGDDGHGHRRVQEEHVRARDHVHARGHHGGGVNQRADRRGAFHGVGQPDVQRNLRGLAGRADQQQKRGGGQHAGARGFHGHGGRAAEHRREIQRAELPEQQEQAQQEAEVADAVDQECLVAGVGGGLLQEPEADEQVAAQSDAFPADEHQQVVGRQHQRQHEEHEQVQVGEKAAVAGIVGHVAGGIEVNEPADAGDHDQHHHGERIDLQGIVGAEVAGDDPGEIGARPGNLRRAELRELARQLRRGQSREAGRAQRDGVGRAARPVAAEKAVGCRAQQRQQRE